MDICFSIILAAYLFFAFQGKDNAKQNNSTVLRCKIKKDAAKFR
ncbi:hypothetical protein BACEGG_01236 [Bacteroides eggerthii DSM 20697]|nr:hypothetical protein BACEGG_01236 [Bacteroides eggerthii DSM 20697]